jgi:F0F1-type ATP synthase assembly protein I
MQLRNNEVTAAERSHWVSQAGSRRKVRLAFLAGVLLGFGVGGIWWGNPWFLSWTDALVGVLLGFPVGVLLARCLSWLE